MSTLKTEVARLWLQEVRSTTTTSSTALVLGKLEIVLEELIETRADLVEAQLTVIQQLTAMEYEPDESGSTL